MARIEGVKCDTPACIEAEAKWGSTCPHQDAVARKEGPTCEGCGGTLVDGEWKHWCRKCGQSVEPGALTGLFVPHLCRPCKTARSEAERASGHVCRMCGKAYSDCCC